MLLIWLAPSFNSVSFVRPDSGARLLIWLFAKSKSVRFVKLPMCLYLLTGYHLRIIRPNLLKSQVELYHLFGC